jgi:hypothetical protein
MPGLLRRRRRRRRRRHRSCCRTSAACEAAYAAPSMAPVAPAAAEQQSQLPHASGVLERCCGGAALRRNRAIPSRNRTIPSRNRAIPSRNGTDAATAAAVEAALLFGFEHGGSPVGARRSAKELLAAAPHQRGDGDLRRICLRLVGLKAPPFDLHPPPSSCATPARRPAGGSRRRPRACRAACSAAAPDAFRVRLRRRRRSLSRRAFPSRGRAEPAPAAPRR